MSTIPQLCKKRLMGDIKLLQKEPMEYIETSPDDNDMLIWYFLVKGPEFSDYKGGYYIGKIMHNAEYPFKSPDFMMLTPNGRFNIKSKICLSNSSYHSSEWSPVWNILSILTGFLSIMLDDKDNGISHIHESPEKRRKMAGESIQYNINEHPNIIKKFTRFLDENGQPRPIVEIVKKNEILNNNKIMDNTNDDKMSKKEVSIIKPVEKPIEPIVEEPVKPIKKSTKKPIIEEPTKEKPVKKSTKKTKNEKPIEPIVQELVKEEKPIKKSTKKTKNEKPIEPIVEEPVKPIKKSTKKTKDVQVEKIEEVKPIKTKKPTKKTKDVKVEKPIKTKKPTKKTKDVPVEKIEPEPIRAKKEIKVDEPIRAKKEIIIDDPINSRTINIQMDDDGDDSDELPKNPVLQYSPSINNLLINGDRNYDYNNVDEHELDSEESDNHSKMMVDMLNNRMLPPQIDEEPTEEELLHMMHLIKLTNETRKREELMTNGFIESDSDDDDEEIDIIEMMRTIKHINENKSLDEIMKTSNIMKPKNRANTIPYDKMIPVTQPVFKMYNGNIPPAEPHNIPDEKVNIPIKKPVVKKTAVKKTNKK